MSAPAGKRREADLVQSAAGALAAGLDTLDPTSRLILAMLHVDGLTESEVAAALDLEPARVEDVAKRARARLLVRVQEKSDHRPAHRAA